MQGRIKRREEMEATQYQLWPDTAKVYPLPRHPPIKLMPWISNHPESDAALALAIAALNTAARATILRLIQICPGSSYGND